MSRPACQNGSRTVKRARRGRQASELVTLYADHVESCANAIKNAEISVKWRLAGHASFFYPGAAHRIGVDGRIQSSLVQCSRRRVSPVWSVQQLATRGWVYGEERPKIAVEKRLTGLTMYRRCRISETRPRGTARVRKAKQGALSAYGSLLRTPGYTCPSKNLDVMD